MMKEGMPIRVMPEAVTAPREQAARQRQHDGERAGQRQVGNVDAGILQREEGDDDTGRVGHRGDAEIDLGARG